MKYIERLLSQLVEGCAGTNFQASNHIRKHTETECNSLTFEPGALRQFDLKHFARVNIPTHIQNTIAKNPDSALYLYAIFSDGKHSKTPWLWVLTNEYHQPIETGIANRIRNADSHLADVLHWFTHDRIVNTVRGYQKSSMDTYIERLERYGMTPSSFSIVKNPRCANPLASFESINELTAESALDTLEKLLIEQPDLKFRISIIGHITEQQWESLPKEHRHIRFDMAPQAFKGKAA